MDADLDARTREVTGEWHQTWVHLAGTIRRSAAQGVRFLIVCWDHGPWHRAQRLQRLVARSNRHAKRHGRLRVLLFLLPIKAPWLMPLERETMPALQEAVERRLDRRHVWAKHGRHDDRPSTHLLSA